MTVLMAMRRKLKKEATEKQVLTCFLLALRYDADEYDAIVDGHEVGIKSDLVKLFMEAVETFNNARF